MPDTDKVESNLVNETQKIIEKMLADAQKTQEEMLSKAKEEAEKIINEAKSSSIDSKTTGAETVDKKHIKYMNEEVEVYLFKDNGKYNDDVFVAVNGKSFLIQRGKKVKVPRYVKEVLDNMQAQDQAAAIYMDEQSSQYEKSLN